MIRVMVVMVVMMMVLVVVRRVMRVMVMMVIMVVLTQNDDPSWSVPSCLGQLPCGPPCHHLSSVVNVQDRNGLELQLTKTTQYLSEVRYFRQTIPLLFQQTENSSLYPIGVTE